MDLSPPRGTRDFFPEDMRLRNWLFDHFHAVSRLFGFELLMAPYAIAHLKLGLILEETGYQFKSDQRLGIYLTNSLEDPSYKTS